MEAPGLPKTKSEVGGGVNQREQAQQLFEQGHSPAEIEELTNGNIPANKVRAWKSRYKWAGGKSNKSVAQRKPQQKAQRNTATAPPIDEQLIDAVEENSQLSDQQKAFCLHYTKTFNATASYLRAYPGCTYESAGTAGPRLLEKVAIREEVQRLKKMRQMNMLASADDVVEKMMQIAFVDITDFVEFGRVEVGVMGAFGPVMVEVPGTGEKVQLTKTVNDVRFKESNAVDGSLLAEVKQGKDGASIKLPDRMKALHWLAGYFELNPLDKHKVAYDNARLEIEQRALGLQEAKINGVTADVDEIKENLRDLMNIVASPVPNRSIDDCSEE